MRKYCLLHINNSTTNKTSKVFLIVVHFCTAVKFVTYTEAWNIAFKTWKPLWKMWKYKNPQILYLKENKFKGKKKGQRTIIMGNLILPKRYSIFNELVVKNTRVNPI